MMTMIPPPVRSGQPVNLLDNSDFAIAQAGYGGMHGATRYVADRWANTYGFGTFAPANPGIVMTYATNHAYANQRISNSTRLVGKVLTFAVMTDEFGLLLCTGRYTATNAVDARYYNDRCEIVIVDGSARIVVVEGALTVRWAALYEGAYTDNTLPPYVPPDPAVELIKCQKYFVAYESNHEFAMISTGVTNSDASGLYLPLHFPVPMRAGANPTISYNDIRLFGVYNGGNYTPVNITIYSRDTSPDGCKYVVLRANVAGLGLTPRAVHQLNLKVGAKLTFSREL